MLRSRFVRPTRSGPLALPTAGRALCLFLLVALGLPSALDPAPAAAQAHLPVAPVQEGWVGGEGSANYRLAARWAPYRVRDMVHSLTVSPNWIPGGDRFWYEWESSDGKFFYLVDPTRASRELIFDRDEIAAQITRLTGDPYKAQHLPIRNIRFVSQDVLHFEVESSLEEEERREEVDEEREREELQREEREERTRERPRRKVHYFEYEISTRTLRELEDYEHPDAHPRWASVSPDEEWVVFTREFNLWMMSYQDYRRILDARRGKTGDEADEAEDEVEVEEIQLTFDGEKDYAYGNQGRGDHDEETEEEFLKRQNPNITWSHDSRYFALVRRDRRHVGDLWVVHVVGNRRPQLESYKYDMPGEEDVSQDEIVVFDMQARSVTRINDDPWKDQRMGLFNAPVPVDRQPEDSPRALWLSDRSDELYFWRRSRNQHRVDLMVYDPGTSQARVVVEERLNTYVEHQTPRRLANGDLVWWSERDGWAHLYRHAPDGRLVARLTQGPWHVGGVMGIDDDQGWVYFRANAREEGEDPYYQHMYRVRIDGSGLQLLNPGNYDHRMAMSPSSRFFVSNYSRVDTAPRAALHDGSGRRVLDLEEADVSRLEAAGFRYPEPFHVKAADGITDIYGVMYKPYDFDENKVYPVVAYVYPGPQTESVSKFFSLNPNEQALAQFGMIVITVGNRGGHPDRSKWYHNYGYGNLRDYGLADKKAAIEQLADRHRFVDVDRVGIYGHSGGGFMSTAAMLVYPDFFKVAVSSAGNHDNDVYNQNWSEKHHGVKEVVGADGEVTFEYSIDRNSDLARNLKGRLLLTTGDVDNNVHHAGTFRMAEALIRANKRFDFFIYPGQRHGYGNMSDYWFWQRGEYFVRHLLGDTRWSVDINELNNEAEQNRPAR
jgi:dipeptidyl-peptidase 4